MFSEKEQSIIQYGADNGKSGEEIKEAIINYRLGRPGTETKQSAEIGELPNTETNTGSGDMFIGVLAVGIFFALILFYFFGKNKSKAPLTQDPWTKVDLPKNNKIDTLDLRNTQPKQNEVLNAEPISEHKTNMKLSYKFMLPVGLILWFIFGFVASEVDSGDAGAFVGILSFTGIVLTFVGIADLVKQSKNKKKLKKEKIKLEKLEQEQKGMKQEKTSKEEVKEGLQGLTILALIIGGIILIISFFVAFWFPILIILAMLAFLKIIAS
ncbi:hypothetical protein KKC65_02880 [Patescibacteria group bacterium]|nr:hypothetical protein [Patescibacteria group bacterium]